MSAGRRRGAALLEVIAALTLLMLSGVAGAALLTQTTRTVSDAQRTDRSTAKASAVLARVSMWTAQQLDAAQGEHAQFGVAIAVERFTPTLYRVAISDTLSRVSLVTTVLYRRVELNPGAR